MTKDNKLRLTVSIALGLSIGLFFFITERKTQTNEETRSLSTVPLVLADEPVKEYLTDEHGYEYTLKDTGERDYNEDEDYDADLPKDFMFDEFDVPLPYAHKMTNMDIFPEVDNFKGLPYLEKYLQAYLYYYGAGITDTSEWSYEYIENTFHEDVNRPYFYILYHLPDDDMYIQCIWDTVEERYRFKSHISGEDIDTYKTLM